MREIVIVSGKGGTGKSSLSASFAYLEKDNALINDCDVDGFLVVNLL
jgi:MinD superfamily P-loop ATPase